MLPDGHRTGAIDSALVVEDLRVYYHTDAGPVKAVDGVSFALGRGERFGLVGESGSGKSTTAWAIMRLIKPPGRIESGVIHVGDTRVDCLSDNDFRRLRLAKLALVPQGAMNSLNPVTRVREQMLDGLRAHPGGVSGPRLNEKLLDLTASVGLPPHVLSLYPHELSGGMRQRVCIAIAISLGPQVIIADEPTSALDVVVQRQIMQTLSAVQKRLGASIVLVGHDMGLMAKFVDRIGVMYGGRLVEIGPVREIFRQPLHPYTQLLISSLPTLHAKGALHGIPGTPPSLLDQPSGCIFHPRCPQAMACCAVEVPVLRELRPGHWVSCHLYPLPAVAAS
jgi:peptide/nickel transport system ATP-binding protein